MRRLVTRDHARNPTNRVIPQIDRRRTVIVSAVVLLALPCAYLSVRQILVIATQPAYTGDWWLFQQAGSRIGTGTMYHWVGISAFGDPYTYRYTPLFAYAMVPFVTMGLWVWRALHVAALFLLPWRLTLAALLFFPFWFDVFHGNDMTFVAVAGCLALAGSRWGTVAYVLLFLLVPRPLQLPLMAWILWKAPRWRLPIVSMVAGYALLTLMTGEAFSFLAAITRSGDNLSNSLNFGLSRWIGWWWMAIGLPLSIWLTMKGRIGYASMAVMPYFLPFHALMGLLELPSSQLKLLSASPGSEPVPSDNMAPVGVLAIGGD